MVVCLLGGQLASGDHLGLESAVLDLLDVPGLSLERDLVPASLVPDLRPFIDGQPRLVKMTMRIRLLSRLKDLSESCLLALGPHLCWFRLSGLCCQILQVYVALVPVLRLRVLRLRLPLPLVVLTLVQYLLILLVPLFF